MSFLTADFETYWADDYSLSRKDTTTESYINDSRFEVIGVSVKVDTGAPVWFSGTHEETKSFLLQFDWANSALLGHNLIFDAAILAWKFDIHPAYLIDTLCMARALHGVNVGGSLKFLAEKYNIGVKGTEAIESKGLRRAEFAPSQLRAYGAYCCNDVKLTYDLFNILSKQFPEEELDLIDMTLKMYTQPVFELDNERLVERLDLLARQKQELLQGLMQVLEVGSVEEVTTKLRSNPKFAKLLEAFDIKPPTKISPKTGNIAFAFAKNDVEFIELQEHPNPMVQELCAARLGSKSTIEVSRVTKFIAIGARNKGKLPMPLKYYGAHTGRWAGSEGVNPQNLPTRDKDKKTLKNSIIAPERHTIINCDSSQIEARIVAWLAGQDDIVQAFAEKRDVYCEDASKVYKRVITKADNPIERFVGKTMRLGLGFGTGKVKLQHTLETTPPGAKLTVEECGGFVDVWRRENSEIVRFWGECQRVIQDLMSWPEGKMPYYLGKHRCLRVLPDGIHLPNELIIRYPNLRVEDGKTVFDARNGKTYLWGGAFTENVVQALARIVVGRQMLQISAKFPVKLTVHDAAVIAVPDEQVEYAQNFVTRIMSLAPEWAPGLPVACETKFGKSYGECS